MCFCVLSNRCLFTAARARTSRLLTRSVQPIRNTLLKHRINSSFGQLSLPMFHFESLVFCRRFSFPLCSFVMLLGVFLAISISLPHLRVSCWVIDNAVDEGLATPCAYGEFEYLGYWKVFESGHEYVINSIRIQKIPSN